MARLRVPYFLPFLKSLLLLFQWCCPMLGSPPPAPGDCPSVVAFDAPIKYFDHIGNDIACMETTDTFVAATDCQEDANCVAFNVNFGSGISCLKSVSSPLVFVGNPNGGPFCLWTKSVPGRNTFCPTGGVSGFDPPIPNYDHRDDDIHCLATVDTAVVATKCQEDADCVAFNADYMIRHSCMKTKSSPLAFVENSGKQPYQPGYADVCFFVRSSSGDKPSPSPPSPVPDSPGNNISPPPPSAVQGSSGKTVVIIGSVIGAVVVVGIAVLLFLYLRFFSPTPSSDDLHVFRRFSMKELKRCTNNWKNQIGKGGFGRVFSGRLPDGRECAVKEHFLEHLHHDMFEREVTSMSQMNHPHLIRLLGYCVERRKYIIVYELAAQGSLHRWLHSPDRERFLTVAERLAIAKGTAKALKYLHQHNIVHCDIKPLNILLCDDLLPKLADFGIIKLLDDGMTRVTQGGWSRGYVDPSCVVDPLTGTIKLSTKNDVYSFGVVFLELMSGRRCVVDEVHIIEWARALPADDATLVDPNATLLDLNDTNLDPTARYFLSEDFVEQIRSLAFDCIGNSDGRPTMENVVIRLEAMEQGVA